MCDAMCCNRGVREAIAVTSVQAELNRLAAEAAAEEARVFTEVVAANEGHGDAPTSPEG